MLMPSPPTNKGDASKMDKKHDADIDKMIDEYLPNAKNPQVKSMAEKMKSDQTREIAELRRKLSAM